MVLEQITAVFSSLLSLSGIIALLLNVVVTALIITLVGMAISHEVKFKNSIIMAFVAYFILPLVVSAGVGVLPLLATVGIVLPLIVWVALGEVLLPGSGKQKAAIAIVAFLVNLVLLGTVTGLVMSVLP